MLSRRWLLLLALPSAVVAGGMLAAARADRSLPDDPLAPWLGRWEGEFVAYDIEGRERDRMHVIQQYRVAGPNQQNAIFAQSMPDGSVGNLHAVNLVRDGELICRVQRIGPDDAPIGEMTEYRGVYVGPGQIIWHRRVGEAGFETFHERVEGDTYWVYGAGVSTSDPLRTEIFEGRYTRVRG